MSAAEVPAGREPLEPRIDGLGDVKIIGLGGVGGPVSRYAGLYLSSLDTDTRLVLIDGDSFELSNATRMLFGSDGNKAAVMRDELQRQLQDGRLTVEAVEQFVTPDSIGRIVREGDIVLLAVDNHATRKLVSEHCATLSDVCLISGGNDGVGPDSSGRLRRGTAGNCQIQLRAGGVDRTPTLTAFHPEIESPADSRPDDASCTELLESVPQIVFTNLMTASSMLNAFWLYLCGGLHYPELVFDVAEGLMRPVDLPLPD